MTPLVLRDVAVQRGDRIVLRGIGLRLASGQGLHLHGPNGCGKTSLLEIIAGLRAPASGVVEGLPAPEDLHWIGHRNGLHPALSVEENLRFWCALQHQDAAQVPDALERLGLAPLRRRACRTLSTGQRRRAALARLLLARRPLWLLDEPFASLDAEGIERLASLLAAQLQGGGSILLTSHQALPGAIADIRRLELG